MSKYDDPELFKKYMELHRARSGLEASDEWYMYKTMLPDFKNKRVLDLGCGPGLHSEYAAANGASKVVGVDLSSRMVERAKSNSAHPDIVQYECKSLTDINYAPNSFDAVISAMAFHYIPSFDQIVERVERCLVDGGTLVFSTTNPIFTASGDLKWYHDDHGVHWKIDNYFEEGRIVGDFLGEDVNMYHRTMSTFINTLIDHGFKITRVIEPKPQKREEMDFPYETEIKRPRFLVISAQKIKS